MARDTVTLASGHQMPLVGFGLWKVPADKAADIVYNAIKVGYRLFDGAYDYQNEKEAGDGIRRAIKEGLVKRDEIFVTTKLWNNYHQKDHALQMAKAQNEAWGLDYIDLYLIHFPVALKYIEPEKLRYPAWWMDAEHKVIETAPIPLQETWQALEEVVDMGIAKSIGISNAQAQTLYDIQRYARHPISSLQIEHHPYLVQPELVELAQEENIAITAYSSFGPQSFLELPAAFRARAKDVSLLFDVDAVKKAAALLVFFMPESPWWLVSKGRKQQALKNLGKLGHRGEEGRKKLALIELTLEEIKRETEGVTYLECFRKSNLRRTIISIGPLIIQVLTGITFVAGYFTYYLQIAGYSTEMSFRIQIAQPVLSIFGNLVAAAIIDRVGRRNLTFYGLCILVVLLFIEGGLATGGSPAEIKGTVAMILIYSWMYNVSIGSTAFSILAETSTSRLRVKTIAIGLAIQNAINVMWQFVLPYMFNPDKGNLGGKVAFVFGGPSFLCIAYLWFFQPETAGRTYEELDEMFTKHVPARKFKTYKTEAQMKGEVVKEVHVKSAHQ